MNKKSGAIISYFCNLQKFLSHWISVASIVNLGYLPRRVVVRIHEENGYKVQLGVSKEELSLPGAKNNMSGKNEYEV